MKVKKYLAYSALIVFILYWSFSVYNIYCAINYHFNGAIQFVLYKSGHYRPTITVNNNKFDLEWVRWIGDEQNVIVGDSVIKRKGSQWMLVIKKINYSWSNTYKVSWQHQQRRKRRNRHISPNQP